MPDPVASPPKPDAVLVPMNYPKGKIGMDRHIAFRTEFGALLCSTGLVIAYPRPSSKETLIVPFSQPQRNHRYWPQNHPNAGQEFYDWKDRGDGTGVKLGYLTDEAKAYIAESESA
jgi:hypothetical protein